MSAPKTIFLLALLTASPAAWSMVDVRAYPTFMARPGAATASRCRMPCRARSWRSAVARLGTPACRPPVLYPFAIYLASKLEGPARVRSDRYAPVARRDGEQGGQRGDPSMGI
jgi:hypothetical protein